MSSLLTSYQDSLLQRTQILEDAQGATKSAITKRRNVERLKGSSSINPIKVDDAIGEMREVNLGVVPRRTLTLMSVDRPMSWRDS